MSCWFSRLDVCCVFNEVAQQAAQVPMLQFSLAKSTNNSAVADLLCAYRKGSGGIADAESVRTRIGWP